MRRRFSWIFCLGESAEGVDGSLIYLVDRYGDRTIYDVDFHPPIADRAPAGVGLAAIDHLTHNVHRGRMALWAEFYERLFNFREIRYFDIEGQLTGLKSKAMTSPDGKIRIPINESADDKSQIAEYLEAYHGEGIQHIALAASEIYKTVEALRARNVNFMAVPDTYYEAVETRLPGHGEDLARLQRDQILIDGAPAQGQGLLLQIFTETVIGPIFFEIIQRKGNDGFGEGNFRALFESIERDQIRRGVLAAPAFAGMTAQRVFVPRPHREVQPAVPRCVRLGAASGYGAGCELADAWPAPGIP